MALERGKGLVNQAHLVPDSELKREKEKLTLSIDRELKEWVKIYALKTNRTVSQILEEKIQELRTSA